MSELGKSRGFVPLYRCSLESEVWTNPDLWRLWTYCMMKANHKEGYAAFSHTVRPVPLKPGQFVTGREVLNAELYPDRKHRHPSSRATWRHLMSLKDMAKVSIEVSNQGSIVTLCHWGRYNPRGSADGQRTGPRVSSECPASVHIQEQKKQNNRNTHRGSGVCGDARISEPAAVHLTACYRQALNLAPPEGWYQKLSGREAEVLALTPEDVTAALVYCTEKGKAFGPGWILNVANQRVAKAAAEETKKQKQAALKAAALAAQGG